MTKNPLTILSTEFSDQFVQAMQNRMVTSYYRYGPVRDAYPNKINAIESLRLRLDKYDRTGNTEYLVDAANFAMIEFMYPGHPGAHFTATDAKESPGRVNQEYEVTHNANDQLSSDAWDELMKHRRSIEKT